MSDNVTISHADLQAILVVYLNAKMMEIEMPTELPEDVAERLLQAACRSPSSKPLSPTIDNASASMLLMDYDKF